MWTLDQGMVRKTASSKPSTSRLKKSTVVRFRAKMIEKMGKDWTDIISGFFSTSLVTIDPRSGNQLLSKVTTLKVQQNKNQVIFASSKARTTYFGYGTMLIAAQMIQALRCFWATLLKLTGLASTSSPSQFKLRSM